MARSYLIPDNFIDGGKVLGGAFKTRNFVEAILLCGTLVLISFQIPCGSLQTRISVTIFMGAPGLILGLIGINNDPLSVFLKNVFQWYRSRKTMLYNSAVQGRSNDIVEQMMDQKSPQEIIANQIQSLQERGETQEQRMVEGVDFYFEEDPELSKYSDKKTWKNGAKRKKPVAAGDAAVDIHDLLS